ncbi:MAG: 2-amino-4-hydroxy-6-hydroxymethyldihydropteridine diphosphokinase [Desulfobacterota bacterium]|nr:2-amino-4-hydroxy-6-hydroxymethyldihydropteridine diphosphokinase [Thermodesulfobacteriota bacterium]
MNQHAVYIGIGTNVGNRSEYLTTAIRELNAVVNIHACSSVYETEPLGYTNQPWFLNMVVKAYTDKAPHRLLRELKAIELSMGRKPTLPNGPRCIDLDLLLFDDILLHDKDLTLPHPRIPERKFVLVPLCEIASDVVHPELRKTFRELLSALSNGAQVRLWAHKLPYNQPSF